VAILKGRERLAAGKIHDLRLNIMPDRNDVYLLEGKGDLRFRYYQLDYPAPLVFLIPGFAGSAYAGSACYVAEWLADNGFQVITLPSPFNWNFILAASTHGVPGLRQDTQDLYRAMQLSLEYVKTAFNAQTEGIGLLGLSEGAVNVADISLAEQAEQRLGIERYLLINPPVDLLATAKRIDQMAALGKTYTAEQRKYLEAYAFGVATDALERDVDKANYFAHWDQRLQVSPRQSRYLVGRALQLSLGDSVYVVELVDQPGVLKTPVTREDRAARMAEAHSYGLVDYFNDFLIPIGDRFQSTNHPLTLHSLNQRASLPRIGSQLRKRRDMFLMHNLDDILVTAEDLDYLQTVFGKRATLYPRGGHLGNLWHPQNKHDMLQVFETLHHSGHSS
jgi:hypothetical protein